MAKCIRCGADAWPKRICPECMDKWKDRREAAFNQAVSEIGPLGPETHKAILARVKALEKAAKSKEADNES